MERRRFLASALGLMASPAVVRAEGLMPIFPANPHWMEHDNPVWGRLIVKLPNARNLDGFNGLIQPGQFFWRSPGGVVYDMHQWPHTHLMIKPGMLAVTGLHTYRSAASPRARINRAGYQIHT